ncbi:MAG: spore coat U domain-containing protein [Gallionella sp.]|nr:spore coat U domain-containing protein [Gallionella sp.]
MKNVNTLKIVAAVALALGFGSAQAATIVAGGTMGVSSTVTASCSAFSQGAGFGFAGYTNNSATNVDATTSVTATCTAGTPYTMAVSAGTHYNAAGGMGGGWRNLQNGTTLTSFLGYGIYQDAGYTTFWGSGVGGQGSLGAVASGAGTASYTLYGRIPAGQAAVVGSYTDTVVASLTY